MHKSVYASSLLIIAVLTIGSLFFPDSAPMWLASHDVEMVIARVVIALFMIALLVTHPPRSAVMRALLAVASVGCVTWGTQIAFSGGVAFLDTLLLLQAAVSFSIAALEITSMRQAYATKTSRQITVTTY